MLVTPDVTCHASLPPEQTVELPVPVKEMKRRLVYPVAEVAAQLGDVSTRTVYRLMDAGELESVKIGGRRGVPHEALVEFIARQRANPSTDGEGAGSGPAGGAGTGPRPPYPPTPGSA